MLATFIVGYFVIAIVLCSPPISQGDFINSGTPAGVTLSFDCAVREYAYSYGKSMQPRHGEFVELFDALQLQACNMTRPTVTTSTSSWKPPISITNNNPDATECTFYIDSTKGNDNNDGSITSPLQTIQKGITETRRNRSSSTTLCTLYLRNGTFYVSDSILLTSQDSYLIISNYMNEKVTISGGVPLQYADSSWSLVEYEATSWKIYNNSNNCWGRSGANNATTSNDLVRWFGTFTTLNDCIDSIKSAQVSNKYGSFYGLCWNDPSIGSPYGGQCYGIHDISFQPQTESKIYSGRFEGRNIWSIKIKNVEEIGNIVPGLRVNEKRGIRARYPDQITETAMQFDSISGWIPYTTKWEPPTKYPAPKNVIYTADSFKSDPNVEWPMKIAGFNDTDEYTGMGDWGEYHIGTGGTCNHPGIEPNYGYWCSADSPRGSGFQHVSPSGIYLNESLALPNGPYKNISGAVFQVWRPDHWFTMMFDVDSNDRYNPHSGLVNFSYGGFQGGEGTATGAEWYIENVREELTIPNEYYYNTTTNILYFYYNSSTQQAPPNDLLLTATHTKVLFNISGSQKDVIKNITFQGIEFRDTAYSYLDPHGMPSGGDWGLQKQGAITIEGGQNILINSSLFARIDGNCIFIGGYNRNITISHNDFEWIGDTVIASWGYTSSPDNNNLLPNGGPDGRNGDQPRFNHIYNNLVREIGLYQKQSSMYFQAVSCQSIIENNIFFNGPRAAVNFNDGFGGANIMRYNLLINAVRESGDHGPFNSWDRVPYVTNVNSANNGGKSSIIPAFNHIYQNFVIGTYEASYCVDNDDGSSQYSTYQNFFVYGAIGMKSVFNGNTNHHYQNVYAYIDWAYVFTLNSCYRHTGSYDHFRNNSVVLTGLYTDGYPSTCIKVPGFVAYGNSLYNPSGRMEVCGTTLQKWVEQGNDPGTTINKLPTDQQIIQMAKQILPDYIN